jgi:phosphoribosylglycinamide formyltransferase-1
LQAIIDAAKKNRIKAKLALIVCDNPKAYALKRARRAGIETVIADPKRFPTRERLETEIIRNLDKKGIKLIVLAGFMRVLSDRFVRKYRNRILNIHPALLPSFKGAHAIRDALRYGAKVTGPTVHFVTEDVDSGPIILQEACGIKEDDSEKSLLARVHKLEHSIYPKAIDLFARGRLRVAGRRVIIK